MDIKLGQNPMYVKHFDNEDDLLNHLERADPPSAKTRKYLYRGQLGRHEKSWPEIMHGEYPRGFYKIDSIIPSDTRLFSERISKGEVNDCDFQFQFGTPLAHVRYTSTFLTLQERKKELADEAVNDWFDAQRERPKGFKFDKLGSIGQHYGVKTTYLDATTDIHVALFFATYNFQTSDYAGTGDRVIYRIKTDKLLKAQEKINKQYRLPSSERHRAVDLSDTPEQFAPRAIKQAGWSIINFELSDLLEELIEKGGITAFCFVAVLDSLRETTGQWKL